MIKNSRSITSETIAKTYRERLVKNSTKSEKQFIKILDELKIKYSFQEILTYHNSFCIVDFLIGRYIIEIDGGSHNSLKQKVSDLKRDAYFKELGYEVIRIKNEEIYNNRQELCSLLRELFKIEGYDITLQSTVKDSINAKNPYGDSASIKRFKPRKKVKVSIGDVITINNGKNGWRIIGFNKSGSMIIQNLDGKTTKRASKCNIQKITNKKIIDLFEREVPLDI